MSLLKINPSSIDPTGNYEFNQIVVSGINLLQYAQAAYEQANTGGGGSASYYQNTAPTESSTGSLWTNSDTGLVFVNVGDANTATWIEFGPSSGLDSYFQNTAPTGAITGSLWTNNDTGSTYQNVGNTVNTIWVEFGPTVTSNASSGSTATLDSLIPTATYSSNTTTLSLTGSIKVDAFVMNKSNLTSNFTIPEGYNAMLAGPVTIDDNVTITISNTSTLVIV
jgi:hypothetical protein